MQRPRSIAGEIFVGLDLLAIGIAMIAMTWFVQRDAMFADWTIPSIAADFACWLGGVLVAARGIRVLRVALRPTPPPVPTARAARRS